MDQSELFKAILKGSFHMPKKFSPGATAIVSGLLTKDPSMRLGSLASGETDILGSEFLQMINIEQLRRRTIKPPQVPSIKDPLDASNFDDWSHLEDKIDPMQSIHLEDKMTAIYPVLSPEKEAIFDRF